MADNGYAKYSGLGGGGGGGGGVTSLNTLTGALTLAAGTGISITPSGSTLTIANIGAGAGTVSSVALTAPSSILSVSGSPITSSGTLALTLATQSANTVFAGPTTGAAAAPTFRAIVPADITPSGTNTQVLTTIGGATQWANAPTGAVSSVFTRTGAVVAASGDYTVAQVTGAAPLASPTFTGTPAAPTASTADNSTTLATTAFVKAQGYGTGNIVGPGTPWTATMTIVGTNGASTVKDTGINIGAPSTGSIGIATGNGASWPAFAGTNNTVFGSGAGQAINSGSQNVYVGSGAGDNETSASSNVYVGYGAGSGTAGAAGSANVSIGCQAGGGEGMTQEHFNHSVNLGFQAGTTNGTNIDFDSVVNIGRSANSLNVIGTTVNILSIGSNDTTGGPIYDTYIGYGNILTATASSHNITHHTQPDASGTDISNTATTTYMAGLGTGAGHGSSIKWQYGPAGATGTTLNTATDAMVMSATTGVISAPQGHVSGPKTTTAINALVSPVAGTLLYDSTLNEYKYYNGVAWTAVTRTGRTATAASYTALVTDSLVAVTATAAAIAITLPAVTLGSATIPWTLTVKDESGGAATHNITITPASGTIDGAASLAITTNYGSVRLYAQGTNWFTA